MRRPDAESVSGCLPRGASQSNLRMGAHIMRRVILWFILTFGRFATLPVSVAGLALLAGWLALLEAGSLAPALVLAPVVIPFAIASVALAAGLLLLPGRYVA